jgi:hypothetical protein
LNISEAQHNAAGEMVDLIAKRLGHGRAVHPETAISSTARLAGSLLWRSFGIKLDNAEPGTVVLSQDANDKGPMLVGILSACLANSTNPFDREKAQEVGKGEDSQFTVLQSLALVQDEAMKIAERNGLGLEEASQSAALATAFVVDQCAASIGAETAFNVAVYGFIEGTKTVPPALGDAQPGSARRKPWYKLW